MKPFVDFDPMFPFAQPLEVVAPLLHEGLARVSGESLADLTIDRDRGADVPGQIVWGIASQTLGPRLGGVVLRTTLTGCELGFIGPERHKLSVLGPQDAYHLRMGRQITDVMHARRVGRLSAVVSDVIDFLRAAGLVADEKQFPATPDPAADVREKTPDPAAGVGDVRKTAGDGEKPKGQRRRGRLPLADAEKRAVCERWLKAQVTTRQDEFCNHEGIATSTLREWLNALGIE